MATLSNDDPKVVITYGTFDLFHDGHRRILQRARDLGTYLIVAVTSDGFDEGRGKLNVRQTLVERISGVQSSGFADRIIVEEYEGQKINDIKKYHVDVFTVGSDWKGTFDYLSAHCKVVYLERTAGISSTQLRGEVRLGIVGCGRIAKRFLRETKFVSGVRVCGVLSRSQESAAAFSKETGSVQYFETLQELMTVVDAVYIASPHLTHVPYARAALEAGKHVLCEKPLCLTQRDAEELYALAASKTVTFLEAIKTAFMPGFRQMVAIAQSGEIGSICSVDATCTMLRPATGREYDATQAGGSITELASYPLLAIVRLLDLGSHDIDSIRCQSIMHSSSGVDIFSRIDMQNDATIATATMAIGAKAEGDLIVTGTKGYIYVPAPWWLMKSFQLCFEDTRSNRTVSTHMEGDGLRYELAEFVKMVFDARTESPDLTAKESCVIAGCIERARATCRVIARRD
jgi:choline-phosphate cytidylyltransferase